ncbi:polysaccharide deacetylase family protein [Rubrivivax benzoatilyticus]|uniref:Polysaccharide deacetylase family protein n=1 Tax=Rubrivivax benzoatilyticus TaxID=316997 RepID=A0ABX0I1G8_9BURK|nr:polysaccharide deacetylase family protein [Rubrivivax benzoatilyticus]EGJ09805.1 polysaccharide deacetylase [Rubrivivax benzoatilyticus JA2 = ATCC BAA-35]NHK99420.1 polysaccharide deacetylase family protein [Rubrivivax benzoatilyticus]NHL25294.1 polysaccharide deacetylase family protein [Rubrivivax benzoatilyticus]
MIRAALGVVSPAGARARLSILIFHRVLPQPDPLFPEEMHAGRFDTLCGWLAGWFNVLPLDEAVRRLAEGTLPPRALAITFDDGYADNHDVALPILRRHGLNATFFVATGFLDGGIMWNDVLIEALRRTREDSLDAGAATGLALGRLSTVTTEQRRAAVDTLIGALKYLPQPQRARAVDSVARSAGVELPRDLMMTGAQVRALHAAGMRIGGHTVGHPILARLDSRAARAEIADGKAALEALVDAPVRLFAYPNGKPGEDFGDEHVAMARELGFEAAVTTGWGAAGAGADHHRLPRFTPWDRRRWRFGLRMLGNLRQTS